MREHADGQLVAHASACPVGTHADARRRTGHATCKINSDEEYHLAVRGAALTLILFIAGYLVSLSRHPRPSALWILAVSVGCAAIFTAQELLFGRESLAYRCFSFGLFQAAGFLIIHVQAIWWALGEWLVLALVYR